MALSSELISEFVKVTQDKINNNENTTAYGQIVDYNGVQYVKLDGSDLLTPIDKTTVVHDGDRVIVTIKNHTATVTGDLTSPSASDEEVKEIGSKISEFEIVIADKVSTEQLEAEIAKIDKLIADEVDILTADIETLNAKTAKIDELEADIIIVNEKLIAHDGEFTTLKADIATFEDLTVNELDAIKGDFNTLNADYATFKQATIEDLTVVNASIENLEVETAKITDLEVEMLEVTNKLTVVEADIETLNVDYATFKQATIEDLTAVNASIENLEVDKLSVSDAEIKYANIDFANINMAAVEKLFTDSGIIKDLVVSEGTITGELVGVTIRGDLIIGNTIQADKLVVKGEDGLYYKLNLESLGAEVVSTDPKYQNGLDGSTIIAKSIVAEKISVNDLVAFGATIGGFNITNEAIYSGVKESVANTTRGIYMDKNGQINIGDSSNYIKYYKDVDDVYKLEIKAGIISMGSSGKTLEEEIQDIVEDIQDINVGGRNLLLGTKNPRNPYFLYPGNDVEDETLYDGNVKSTNEFNTGLSFDFSEQIEKRDFVKDGDEFTYSIWGKTDDDIEIEALINASGIKEEIIDNESRLTNTDFIPPTSTGVLSKIWKRFKYVFKVTRDWLNDSKNLLNLDLITQSPINFSSTSLLYVENNETIIQSWAYPFINYDKIPKLLKPNTRYYISYNVEVLEQVLKSDTIYQIALILYRPTSHELGTVWTQLGTKTLEGKNTGDKYSDGVSFTTPMDLEGCRILTYTTHTYESTLIKDRSKIKITNLMLSEEDIPYEIPSNSSNLLDSNFAEKQLERVPAVYSEYSKNYNAEIVTIDNNKYFKFRGSYGYLGEPTETNPLLYFKNDFEPSTVYTFDLYLMREFKTQITSNGSNLTIMYTDGSIQPVYIPSNTPDFEEVNVKIITNPTKSIDRFCIRYQHGEFAFINTIKSKIYKGYYNYHGAITNIGFEQSIDNTEGKKVYWACPQLEKGNQITDWNEAPEDISNDINDKVSQDDFIDNKNETDSKFTQTQVLIDSINNMIQNLVVDENGNSLMTQTGSGWVFDLSPTRESINNNSGDLANLENETSSKLSELQSQVESIEGKTAYVNIGKDENGDPQIELGASDSNFKVVITNSTIKFLDGTSSAAYVNNNIFYGNNIVAKQELKIGEAPGYIFKVRSNGNLGLSYVTD